VVVKPRLLAPVSPVSKQIQDRLATYYNAINGGDYEQVLQQFSPSYRVKFDADDLKSQPGDQLRLIRSGP